MASGAGSCWVLVALLLVARAFPAAATSFTVGGKSGWTIGVDYTTWASGNTFKVGDSLGKTFCYFIGAYIHAVN